MMRVSDKKEAPELGVRVKGEAVAKEK